MSSRATYPRIIPTFPPSVVLAVLFGASALLHLLRITKFRRTVYMYLCTFGFLRACLFVVRAVWSQFASSKAMGIICGTLLAGGFFIIVEALYILLADWIKILLDEKVPLIYEKYALKFVKLLIPLCSIVGVVGEVLILDSSSEDHIYWGEISRQFSVIGFLIVIVMYFFFVTYFTKTYGNGVAIQRHLQALVLYISAALLSIELVYRTIVYFSKNSDPINTNEWVFYVFEAVPELTLLIVLGGIILGEWFYNTRIEVESTAVVINKVNDTENSSAIMKKNYRKLNGESKLMVKSNMRVDGKFAPKK
ncbi:3257_t:CDS:1 [Acaulospora morrowiae]|uniref:3257_t:CDS:1 n=1 Tax=Acaulospora morrowiae TaxID=94023 RepID=A0A9N8ZCB1_9GLOM|nr:3257_t:CDS:1 [Acaulospora morrowiae]